VRSEAFFLTDRTPAARFKAAAAPGALLLENPSSDIKPVQEWLRRQSSYGPQLPSYLENKEIRRIRHTEHWRRDDPITQLAPGVTRRIKSSITLGVSKSEAVELGASLGLDAGAANIISLNGQISRKLGETVTMTFQRQEEQELTLSNDQRGYYRLFAIWHLVERLEVDLLVGRGLVESRFLASRQDWLASRILASKFRWNNEKTASFIENSSVQVTYADIPARA
jgi:hypothetical protein